MKSLTVFVITLQCLSYKERMVKASIRTIGEIILYEVVANTPHSDNASNIKTHQHTQLIFWVWPDFILFILKITTWCPFKTGLVYFTNSTWYVFKMCSSKYKNMTNSTCDNQQSPIAKWYMCIERGYSIYKTLSEILQ